MPLSHSDWFSEIATSIRELEHEKGKLAQDDANFKIIFREMIQMCLWYVHARAPYYLQLTDSGM